jgi:hypothetical protein
MVGAIPRLWRDVSDESPLYAKGGCSSPAVYFTLANNTGGSKNHTSPSESGSPLCYDKLVHSEQTYQKKWLSA